MKKYILLFNFILVICLSLTAQEATSVSMPSGKEIYIPKDLQGMDLQNPDSKWSYHRMTYTDNFVIFWEKGFGKLQSIPEEMIETFQFFR